MYHQPSSKFWVIIPAAGIGSRMQSSLPKQYLKISGQSILEHTVHCFLSHPRFDSVAIGIAKGDPYFKSLALAVDQSVEVFEGGAERVHSVMNGLAFLAGRAKADDWVWVHDAARPCLSHEDIDALIASLPETQDGSLLAAPIYDTIKKANGQSRVEKTVDRLGLWRAMTPQVFSYSQLYNALDACIKNNELVTDESSAIEICGGQPLLVMGSEKNIKVTRPNDIELAQQYILGATSLVQSDRQEQESCMLYPKIGTGFDVHAFGEGEFVTLGGVKIPYQKGLIAHSDGDVLLHALMDALLGALALGDIGKHFPDTDDRWKGADSRALLRAVLSLIKDKNFAVGNVDATIIAQAPKMAPFIGEMSMNIAKDLGVAADCVGVKATTTECLGFTGRKEGIACQVSVLLVPLAVSNK